ncbi:hypothetical protein DFJ58DRAFT_918032 [Suillus subalutaceus]|uniref:uncharacterized protein n=1 Tax=Suillus subalutaceus TaxID=48586 RepID=UPI001B87BFD7|nr:uncharacterized protein DFJ58DRAFT_918032 [Suillus subalutaceus]KAG1834003.1 hypothetical protein DFJ58DRAFT_918032 [Suillus subalutaceus]
MASAIVPTARMQEISHYFARHVLSLGLMCPSQGMNHLMTIITTPRWKYTRSFVMDGNFKAEHLHPMKPFDEVWLSDGLGFMVGKDRQMNMDYALCEAARHNMEGITRAVTFYDINCQYNKHFRVRVDRSRFLEMVPELTIIPGIGLWHIHGHQDSCYVRYASNFIEGIGRIDGEIMETLWSRLNLISPAARGMSSPHRKECLDYQMNDSNFCKMIRMKRTLCRKYKQAKNGIAESEKAFDILNEAAPGDSKTEWLASERIAQSSRINNPAAMDVYEINIKKAPARRSVATWISMGLAIEEAQIALLIEVRRIGRRTTETQKLDIARQRDRLQGQIDGFTRSAITHLGEGFDADEDPEDLYLDILDDLDDDLADFTETSDTWANSPELTVIPLPSNLGVDRCRRCMADDLILLEMSLLRQAKFQALKTRAWSQVTSVQQAVSLHASIYTKTRKQMMQLEPGQDQVQKYKPLLREQLKISTAVGDPNARGQRNESLAWFWSVEVDLGGPDHSWNEEFYRVHWLRAKALRDRWKEEMMLVQLEMDWTCNFFLWKATQWGDRMRESLVKHLPGHACYLGRQSQMYSLLAQDAQAAFQDLKTGPGNWPGRPMLEFENFYQSTSGSYLDLRTNCHCHCHFQLHNPALTMSVLHTPPTSPSNSQTSGNGFRPLTLTQADIAATMSMAASRIRASISQYQMEAAHTQEPSATRITHFKAGLQWEIATFVTPILQYSAARNIISVVPSPVAHILQLIPKLTWNMVPDHIFSSHLCQFQDVADLGDPSRIVSTYGTPWWTGSTAIPNELWPWDQVFANCVCHYQHWLSGVEDERLVVPEQVDESSGCNTEGTEVDEGTPPDSD